MLSTLCAQGSTNVVRMSPVPPSTELADMVATINAVRCVRCVSPQIRYDGHSIVATNGIASGTNGPRATLLRFDFKCRKCGVKFRKIEVRQTGATL
jgi:ribosomal protein L40E